MGCPRSLDKFTQSRFLLSDGEDSMLTGHVRVEVSTQEVMREKLYLYLL